MPLLPRHRVQAKAFRARLRGRRLVFELEVIEVIRLAESAVKNTLADPDELPHSYRFEHGQHVILIHEHEGTEVRRSYSICEPAQGGEFSIAVRSIPGGIVSTYLTDSVRPGDRLRVMTPGGHFSPPLDPEGARRWVAVAAGSGITPIYSILATVLHVEPESSVTLVYANRSRASTMLWEELQRLELQYRDRLRVYHHLSRTPARGGTGGRLNWQRLQAILEAGGVGTEDVDEWVMCGPAELMDEVAEELEGRGVGTEHIHRELFTADQEDGPELDERPLLESEVTLQTPGGAWEFTLSSHGQPVLSEALGLKIDIPYGCADGLCGTCRAKLIEGDVAMDRTSGLSRRDVQEGYVLACQAHPISERVVIDVEG